MAGAAEGGAEAFFERLAIALEESGALTQKVVIRPQQRRVARLREAGVDLVTLPFGGRLDFRTRTGLAGAIGAFDPDVVLSWMNRATSFCSTRNRGSFVHVGRLGGYYNLEYYRGCDHLIANTPDIADYIRRAGWSADRVHCLPNFVTAATAPPVSRAAMNTPPEAQVVLALGRLHPNKGFDVLIRALDHLPGYWLWLAGSGPEERALRRLAASVGVDDRVRFLGWRDDTASLFAAADVFICPSRHEPLGNVVLEAWAHRVPVVAAASAGPAALIEDGRTGVLVPIEDARAIAGAVRKVARDPALAGRLVDAGRSRFEEAFTEAAVVGRYLDFFRTVTN